MVTGAGLFPNTAHKLLKLLCMHMQAGAYASYAPSLNTPMIKKVFYCKCEILYKIATMHKVKYIE